MNGSIKNLEYLKIRSLFNNGGEGFKKRAAFTLAEVPEARQYGSKQELSAMAKVEPEARQHGSKQAAFTLAEVLITLGIIGVVAAMTIPTLMKNYQKRVTLTQLQQTYSMLSQAVKMSTIDNGEITQWNIPNSSDYATTDEFVSTYLLPYLKGVTKCNWNVKECEPKKLYNLYGSNAALSRDGVNYYRLANGAVMYAWPCGSYVQIAVFSQGYQKRAIFGVNVFSLQIVKAGLSDSSHGIITKDGVYFYGEGYDRNTLIDPSRTGTCSKTNTVFSGLFCGALIKLDGWQINYDF